MNPFRTFRGLTVISVVHMVANMLTLRLQLLEVFRLHVMPRHIFETKRRKRKPVKHQFSKPQVFVFVIFGMLLMRCRSRLGTEAVEREREREQYAFIHQLDRIKRQVQPVFLFCDV